MANMPRRSRIAGAPPATVQDALERLGRNLRTARLRRKLPQAALAERVGVSRFLVADIEKGKPTVGIAAHLGALWALGLLSHMEEGGRPRPRRGRQGARTGSEPEDRPARPGTRR